MTLCPQLRRLSAEHARWLAELACDAGVDAEGRRVKLLALWEREILPHCRAEEDVLLPELAAKVSESDAAIVFTLSDHVALRQLARELRSGEAAARVAALAGLARKLAEHFAFEERTLFPALQVALGCDHLARLAPEIAAVEGEAPPRSAPSSVHSSLHGRKGR